MELIKKYIFVTLSWLCIYFYPVGPFILLIGFFIGADTVTGTIAALRRGEEFRTKRFSDFIWKFVVYGVAILVAHVLQTEFFPDFPGMKIIAGLIAYNELMSIDENIHSLTGVSLFKFFIKKFKQH